MDHVLPSRHRLGKIQIYENTVVPIPSGGNDTNYLQLSSRRVLNIIQPFTITDHEIITDPHPEFLRCSHSYHAFTKCIVFTSTISFISIIPPRSLVSALILHPPPLYVPPWIYGPHACLEYLTVLQQCFLLEPGTYKDHRLFIITSSGSYIYNLIE